MPDSKVLKKILWFVFVMEFFISVINGFLMAKAGMSEVPIITFIKLFIIFIPLGSVLLCWEFANRNFENFLEIISSSIENLNTDNINERDKSGRFKNIIESIDTINKKINGEKYVYEIMNKILVATVANMEFQSFFERIMEDIKSVVESDCAAFYTVNKITNRLEIAYSTGFGKAIYSQFDISIGEGFLGQAAQKNKIQIIKDLPEDSVFTIKGFLGMIVPANVMIVPVDEENEVIGIMVLASIHNYTQAHIDIMDKIKTYIAYAIKNGDYYNKNIRLTNELKFQNQLIQNLNDDLENRIKERTLLLNNIINGIKGAAIISVDTSKRVNLINSEAVRIFDANDIVGKNINFLYTEDNDEFEKKTEKCLEIVLEKGRIKDKCKYFGKDDKIYSFDMELFSMSNDVGESSGITIIIRTKEE